MKTSNKILSLILFAVAAVSLMMSACAAEGLLISPNPLSVTDCKVYTAEELMPYIGNSNGFKAELKELDGKNVIHVTAGGIIAATIQLFKPVIPVTGFFIPPVGDKKNGPALQDRTVFRAGNRSGMICALIR